jgi:DNA-dependent protein kinase catalytic subunit
MDTLAILNEMNRLSKKVDSSRLYQGSELVSKYSEWLDELDCNEFYQVKNYIEIPGQYENSLFSSEPSSQKNVKIASIKKSCLVLGSMRRPKKITIHGSNEKDYHILVKGGEDLRLD